MQTKDVKDILPFSALKKGSGEGSVPRHGEIRRGSGEGSVLRHGEIRRGSDHPFINLSKQPTSNWAKHVVCTKKTLQK